MSTDIYKAAGIIIRDRKLLVEKSVGKDFFISPGGSIEPGETPKQALVRELKEEFDIKVSEKDLEFFGVFEAEAANHPGQKVKMEAFRVKNYKGEPVPSSEVEHIAWIDTKPPKGMKVGSIFEHQIMPKLKEEDLID
ncbi:MAG TPA: NUDIX domain-containing protein [Candidatus Saccharimonadales bacterium]|nr:NUDIX domain-containing protein [Candidatus Saccharimonadales bacterium]